MKNICHQIKVDASYKTNGLMQPQSQEISENGKSRLFTQENTLFVEKMHQKTVDLAI
jgi:hypothetical protein